MTALRYALSGLFVVSVAGGLLILVLAETRRVAGDPPVARTMGARPTVWFGCAAVLFAAIVILTILFPAPG